MRTLTKLTIYMALTMFIFMCLLTSANAWQMPKVGVEGKVEEMQQLAWVERHTHKHEPQYLDAVAAIADIEFEQSVKKLDKRGEVYVGR